MALTNMLNGMDRQIFPMLLPQIEAHHGFSPEQAGLLSTVFTLGLGLAGIPAGMISDRFDRKAVIVVSVGVFSAATGLQAAALAFGDMLGYRVMSGVGEGVQNAALFAVAGAFFHQRRTMALGMLTAAYGLGAALSPLIGTGLMGATGRWQTPMIALALFGIVVMLLWKLVPAHVTRLPEAPAHAPEVEPLGSAPAVEAQVRSSVASRFSLWNVVVLGAVAAVSGILIYSYLGLYPTYLMSARGFTGQEAAVAMSLFGVGGLSAIPLGGLADRWDQKRLNQLALLGFMTVGVSIFVIPSNAFAVQILLSFLMGLLFTGIVYPNSMSLLQKNMPTRQGGLATGVFVALLYIPSSISGYILASLVTRFGWQVAGASMMSVLAVVSIAVMAAYRRSAQLHR